MKYLYLTICIFMLSFCKKETEHIPNNTPYNNAYISTLQIENYVNKLYIDLIGREPLESEMAKNVNSLKTNKLSTEARAAIIKELQSSTTYIEGDSSYAKAYYNRFYEVVKIKMLEGIENDVMNEEKSILQPKLQGAISSGDSLKVAIYSKNIKEIDDILNIPNDYREGKININEIFIRLIDNYVYDKINMNTFNFVNATFEDLFFRYPTQQEYNAAYEMIENNSSQYLLGQSGASKGDYLNILMNSEEFYEGIIIWTYKSLLSRNPTATEVVANINDLLLNKSFQKLQLEIMKTDEYANFLN